MGLNNRPKVHPRRTEAVSLTRRSEVSANGQEPNRLGGIEDMRAALEAAFRDHLVVQAWLGYAQVLFCGFGAIYPMETPSSAPHPDPDFELQTNYADWTVMRNGAMAGSSDDDDIVADAAIKTLEGNHVTEWTFDAGDKSLTIDLAGGLRLLIAPMKDEDLLNKEAWCLRMNDGIYWVVSCGGTIRQHRDD